MAEKVEEKQPIPKLCPYLDRPCIKEGCSQYVKMQTQTLGLTKVIGLCSAPAIVLALNSLTQLLVQQRSMRLPDLLKK